MFLQVRMLICGEHEIRDYSVLTMDNVSSEITLLRHDEHGVVPASRKLLNRCLGSGKISGL